MRSARTNSATCFITWRRSSVSSSLSSLARSSSSISLAWRRRRRSSAGEAGGEGRTTAGSGAGGGAGAAGWAAAGWAAGAEGVRARLNRLMLRGLRSSVFAGGLGGEPLDEGLDVLDDLGLRPVLGDRAAEV